MWWYWLRIRMSMNCQATPAGRCRMLKRTLTIAALVLAFCRPCASFQEESVEVVMDDGSSRTIPVIVPDVHMDASQPSPTAVVLITHGFCTPASFQEWLTIMTPNVMYGGPGPAAITQAGWMELVDGFEGASIGENEDTPNPHKASKVNLPPFLYVTPPAPSVSNVCTLCRTNAGDDMSGILSSVFHDVVPLLPDGCPAWKASEACCRSDNGTQSYDDVQYIRDVLAAVQRKYSVDTKRQYAIGIGNGGFMALRLACDMPEEFAAIASFGGAGSYEIEKCKPMFPTHVLEIHAVDDPFVLYNGSVNTDGVPYPDAASTVSTFAELHGCAMEKVTESVFNLPSQYNNVAVPVEALEYKECAKGGSVSHWKLTQGGHFLPRETMRATWARTVYWFFQHLQQQRPEKEAEMLMSKITVPLVSVPLVSKFEENGPQTNQRSPVQAVRATRQPPLSTMWQVMMDFFNPSTREQGAKTEIVTSTVQFSNLGISALTNTWANLMFQMRFRQQMAEVAGVSVRNVFINSITPGVQVTSTVYFSKSSPTTNDGAARNLTYTLANHPETLFTDGTFDAYRPIKTNYVVGGIEEG